MSYIDWYSSFWSWCTYNQIQSWFQVNRIITIKVKLGIETNFDSYRSVAVCRGNRCEIYTCPSADRQFNLFTLKFVLRSFHDKSTCIDWTSDSRFVKKSFFFIYKIRNYFHFIVLLLLVVQIWQLKYLVYLYSINYIDLH